GPAHRDQLRIPAVRHVLDQRVSGRRAAAADPVDQPGRRPVARRAESEAVAMSKAEPLLGVRGLRTEFLTRDGVLPAVADVSFDIARGEVLGLVGESGSGKSVTG